MDMEAWDEEEEELDYSQHFQVNVAVLEARHLSMINSDCKVVVAIGNVSKTLRSKTARTDAPYFNDLCIFNFYQPLSTLLEEILQVKIYGVPKLLKNRLLGGFRVELSTVWVQPNHRFYHKWAALTDEKNPASGVKGYLKCDIGILAQGTKWKHADMDQAENIQDHLLVPYGEVNDRQRAKFIFSVFRADNFSDYVATQPLKALYAYVRITYGGKTGKTSVARNTFEPLWNEELAFDDMIPALCQNVHIELCDAFKTTANGVLGAANLDLRQLSHESEKGFLPTYGPSFLYLYHNFGAFDRQNRCPYVNCSFTYMCRLLMALRTEVVDYAEDVLVNKPNLSVKPKSIPSISEAKYFHYREFIFFAVVFDILLFDAGIVSSKVSVRVNIGPETPVNDEQILKPSDDVKSALKKQEDEEEEDAASVRSKKTVTFEGDDVTEAPSEAPVEETPRDDPKKQAFLRTLMYWPTKWPEDKKWGREMNERVHRREETKFRKWRQERKRALKDWLVEWRRKGKEGSITSDDATPTKRMKMEESSEMIHVNKLQEPISSIWEGNPSSRPTSEGSNDNDVTTMVKYSSPSVSSKSFDLVRNEEDFDILKQQSSHESTDVQMKEEPASVRRRSPNDGYWPLRTLMAWPKDFEVGRKRRAHTESFLQKLRKSERKRNIPSGREDERTETRGHIRLSELRAWPTEWRWKRKRISASESKPKGDAEAERVRKVGVESDDAAWGAATKNDSETDPREILDTLIPKPESKGMAAGPAREKPAPKISMEKQTDKREPSIPEEIIPPIVIPPVVVPTGEGTTSTLTSDNELPELTDHETSSELSISYTPGTTKADSEESLWSRKTIWPRDVPPDEDEGSTTGSLSEKTPKEEKQEKENEIRRWSDASEEIARTDYSDYESRTEGDSAESPKLRKDVYKDLQDEEEEEEEGEEEEEMADLTDEEQYEKLKDEVEESEKTKRRLLELEEENLVGKEKEFDDAVESGKTKKRYWYSNTKKVFSPDNTTEANVQMYMALKKGNEVTDWVDDDDDDDDDDKDDAGYKRRRKKGRRRGSESPEEDEPEVEEVESEEITQEDDTVQKELAEDIRHIRIYNGCNTTKPQSITTRQRYGYATFSGKYPCLHINGEWPNALRRMYRSNVVQQSVLRFTSGISEVANEVSSENKIEASEKLKRVFSEVSAGCREILTLTAKIEPEDTNLYRERKRYYHREIGELIANMEMASKKKVLVAEDELNRAYEYLSTLKRYASDPEDSFPDTEIWLIKDGKSIAQHRMHTRKIVFSPNRTERGVRSGKIQPVIVRGKDGEVVAKLEMFMWFGLGNHFFECRNMLPSGYAHDYHRCPGTVIADVPLLLTYTEVHYFKCRVHLFQARIIVGADVSGLADPFVRVTVLDQQKESQVQKETLNPTWDETLVFPKLTIYGPAEYFKVNSLTVTIEVIDYDYLSKNELIGRSLLKPTVRLSSEEYIQPKLTWEGMRRDCSETGRILLAAELLETSEDEPEATGKFVGIPKEIRPRYVGHRLEVLFWGVRELRKKATGSTRVFVTLECGGKTLTSPVLKNAAKLSNFPGTVQILRLSLPEEHEYKPPLILKLYQTSSFALKYETYAGNCIIPSVKVFFCETVDDEERKRKEIAFAELLEESKRLKQAEEDEAEAEERARQRKHRWRRMKAKVMATAEMVLAALVRCFKVVKCKLGKSCAVLETDNLLDMDEDEGLDWWVKYHASKEGRRDATDVEKLVIYEEELEAQPEYRGFSDFIYTFNMVMGKVKNEVQSSILMGKVKAAIKLYRWPLEAGNSQTIYGVDIRKGVLKQLPSNHGIKYVVRVYVVSCKNLTPKDLYGKSDPYLILQVGNQKISDEKNYIPKQVNPIFGKCFEFRGVFPDEHLLNIKVMDHDILSDDDLIGETSIDLESRYYTRHHASCGISQTYATVGYSAWRDVFRPTEILRTVCKQSNMPQPVYTETGVRIGEYEFRGDTTNERHKMEVQALAALKKWHEVPLRGYRIVPEHVETRPLYHPAFPGVEQGRMEMWVDIFPADFRYVPPIVDIKPREPVAMELRAIVWNVEDVTMDDTTLIFNEKMSDIYVQGWLNALEEDKQVTDVHYRSMNGEGNFNWRFVFPFKYVRSERRLVVYKKVNAFDVEPEEMKFPCRLELQVWDNDFLSDDFLGSLNLELCAMPRGAKISTTCKLSMFEESTPKINLFKIRRTRGWWPFRRMVDAESSEYSLTGKIDLELEVVTEKEAKEHPVGKGREEPRALPEPKRPETSFIWALNPLKTFRYIICRKYGKHLAILLLLAMLIAFILIGIYAFPGYSVKRMIGA